MLYISSIDPQHQTKRDSAPDQASIANEENFLPGDARLVSAHAEQPNQADRSSHSTHDYDAKHNANERRRPVQARKGEERDAQVAENEALHEKSKRLEDQVGAVLALGR